MRKLYCVICGKYIKFVKPKISHLLEKILVLSIICSKCKNEDEKIFKKEESIKILKFLGLSQEFRLKNIDETINYFLEEIKQNKLMSRKHRKVCTTLNYIEQLLILASTITRCTSISAFASLLGVPIRIASSAIGLKICPITAGIKMYKSMIRKIKKKHDKIVSLAKPKLNSIEVFISKALIDSVISHDEIV